MGANQVLDRRQARTASARSVGEDALAAGNNPAESSQGRAAGSNGHSTTRAGTVAGGSRVSRILQLINTMRSGDAFSIDDLVSRMRISRRTVFRDLDMLAQSGIPCSYDSQRRGYRISERYFPPSLNLSSTEALALHIAAAKIVSSRAFPLSSEALRAAEKVTQSLPLGLRNMCARLGAVVDIRWAASMDTVTTRQIFQTLQEADCQSSQGQTWRMTCARRSERPGCWLVRTCWSCWTACGTWLPTLRSTGRCGRSISTASWRPNCRRPASPSPSVFPWTRISARPGRSGRKVRSGRFGCVSARRLPETSRRSSGTRRSRPSECLMVR